MDSDRPAGEAEDLKGRIEAKGDVLGDAAHKAQGAVDQAKEAVQSAYGRTREAMGAYADQAGELADRTLARGRRYVDEGFERHPEAGRYVEEGRRAVSHSPLAAVLIAGAVGYALALLVHRRR